MTPAAAQEQGRAIHVNERSNDLRPSRRWTIAILSLALVLRVGAAVAWDARHSSLGVFAFGDSVSYWHLAKQIANCQHYQYPGKHARVFRTPLYPIVLAPLFLVFPDGPPTIAARLIGCALGVWAVYGVMRIGRLLLGERASRVAGMLAGVYPGAIGMSVFVLAESLFCPLMIVGFEFIVRAIRAGRYRPSLGWSLIGGAAWGLASLARPSWLLFLPFALPLLFVARFSDAKTRAAIAAGAVLGLCGVMAPWWARSYRLTDRFVLTTLQVGASLYDGLHPGATGASDMSFTQSFEREFARTWDENRHGDYEFALDKAYKRSARQWAQSHPREVGRLILVKLGRMWKPLPSADMFSSRTARVVIFVGYAPLVVCAISGLIMLWRRGITIWLLALPAIYFTILHVIFVSSLRYRQPVMLLWCIPAGWCIAYGWARWRRTPPA